MSAPIETDPAELLQAAVVQQEGQAPVEHCHRKVLCRLQNPFRTTLEQWETLVGWYLQGNHDSRVSQVVQDFGHPQSLQ